MDPARRRETLGLTAPLAVLSVASVVGTALAPALAPSALAVAVVGVAGVQLARRWSPRWTTGEATCVSW